MSVYVTNRDALRRATMLKQYPGPYGGKLRRFGRFLAKPFAKDSKADTDPKTGTATPTDKPTKEEKP
jgi:hypothetical protein